MSQTSQTDNAIAVQQGGPLAALDKIGLTATGIIIPADLEQEDWLALGQAIRHLQASVTRWLVGDWLNFGEHKWGEKYAQGLDLGLDYQYMNDCVWVVSRFEISRRRENLSWSHHREVAALPAYAADKLLDRAEAERLSTRDLREAAREWVQGQGAEVGKQEIVKTGGAHQPLAKVDTLWRNWEGELRLAGIAIPPDQRVRIIVMPLADKDNGADTALAADWPTTELPASLQENNTPDWMQT